MPIKNLTDNDSGFGSGLPLIGRWYKGAPKADGLKDLDHWRVTFEPGYEDLKGAWVEMYGEEPDYFENIFLCGDTVHEAFPTFMEEYNTSQTLIHKCDGEDQIRWWNGTIHSTAKVSCVRGVDSAGKQTGCACKQTGRLMIAVPDFIEASGVIGQFLVTTHAINDILTVFRILKTLENRIGRVSGIPFTFGRADKKINAPKQGRGGKIEGRIKVTKSLFYLYPDPSYTREVLLPAMTKLALPPPEPRIIAPPDMSKTLGSGDRPRIMGRDNVVTLPPPQTDGSSALQPAPIVETKPDAPPAPEAKAVGDWAITENLELIFKNVRTKLKDETLSETELASLVGIKEADVRSKMIWDTQFLTGQIAFDAIIAAFNKPDEPTTPPPVTPPAKTSAIVTRCMYHIETENKTPSSYLVFDVEGLAKQPRFYGRSTTFFNKVGADYYNANGFGEMHDPADTWHDIAPLEIWWELKGSYNARTNEDKTYLNCSAAKPVIEKSEAPVIVITVDESTGEIGFVSPAPETKAE